MWDSTVSPNCMQNIRHQKYKPSDFNGLKGLEKNNWITFHHHFYVKFIHLYLRFLISPKFKTLQLNWILSKYILSCQYCSALISYYFLLSICRPLFSYIEVLLSKIVQKCVFFFCSRTWVITVSTVIALTCLMNELAHLTFFTAISLFSRSFLSEHSVIDVLTCSFIRQVRVH